ncbi:MAG: hypothetical protein L3J71_17475, partial [Victivallaceae bacterium]|nr:hypothetical protein [Victivallaceae bacterium]
GEKAMLMIGNWNNSAQTVQIRIDAEKLLQRAKITKARDMLNNTPLQVSDNKIIVKVEQKNIALIEVY